MKRLTSLVVVVAMVAALGAGVASAAAEELVTPSSLLPSKIESYKFYDTNMNGRHDYRDDDYPGEPGTTGTGIKGWRIELWKDGALFASSLTDAAGWYHFINVPPGTYQLKEAVPASAGCWVQTRPPSALPYYLDPAGPDYFTINVTGDGYNWSCMTRFGNVCKRCVKGYTMGFWSNKNGLKLLKAYAGPDGIIENIPKYGPMSVAEIQAMAQQANAVDMCVMLKAQYVAHWLSVNVKGADYSDAGVVLAPGELKDYDEAMAEFADFDCATATRDDAEMWKDFFDGLNNNRYPVVEYFKNMCPVPTSWK